MDPFGYALRGEVRYHENSKRLVELVPRLKDSLLRQELPLPTSVSLSRFGPDITLHYVNHDNYRELSWLFRIFFGVKISRFENVSGETQRLVTRGRFPRHTSNGVEVYVNIDIGLRNTCHIEYEDKVVTVAKIVCNEPIKDIEGLSILSAVELEEEVEAE